MTRADVFYEVFRDLRFPAVVADVGLLRDFGIKPENAGQPSHLALRVDMAPGKRDVEVASLRGFLSRAEVPRSIAAIIAASPALTHAGLSGYVHRMAGPCPYAVYTQHDRLVWTEDSLWPIAFSTLLQQLSSLTFLHLELLRVRIEQLSDSYEKNGFAPENLHVVSEFPRQLPTHVHYAFASLGAWLGGAINCQYFAYYASIRQITHPTLNVRYAKQIGYSDIEAIGLDASGIVALPDSLVKPLLHAQGDSTVFGSLPLEETNAANQPNASCSEPVESVDPAHSYSGFLLDKFYRAVSRARHDGEHALYGSSDVMRDHYREFYDSLGRRPLVRCKHYCAPIVNVASLAQVHAYASRIPIRNQNGLFFRGQPRLHIIPREDMVKRMLFGGSCSLEPSFVNSAARQPLYDYDEVHFWLKAFLDADVLRRDDEGERGLVERWRRLCVAPDCAVDEAVLALAQHYGVPSHGLDVTTSLDVAGWFATNLYQASDDGSSYRKMPGSEWPAREEDWPVVVACQTVTWSIEQSVHDCEVLAGFGYKATRPSAQKARFFQGGHSDHQNRLAEAVVCVFRLAPGNYETTATFDELFPRPDHDPAYRLMLDFAASPFGARWRHLVNRFH